MLSKLITLQNLKGLELDLDTLYGTCWVQLFIRAMGIDFDLSIFLMSSWFGYMGSCVLKLIRTDVKKNYWEGNIYFYWPFPSFYQHLFSNASCSHTRFLNVFMMFRAPINTGPSSLENSSCYSLVKFIHWVWPSLSPCLVTTNHYDLCHPFWLVSEYLS